MILPRVRPSYDAASERERNRTLEIEDEKNRKTGQDVEIGDQRLILTSPDGTRYSLTVNNMGVLVIAAAV